MNKLIEFKNVSKEYVMGEVTIKAVDNISFTIEQGELVVVLGASGAGKSTILNMLGGMDRVTKGELLVNGENITTYNDNKMTAYRRQNIGFVFQFYNLITNLNALENVEFASDVCKDHFDPKEIMRIVGLEDRLKNFPSQLSGGEQQRVAIARDVAKNPLLLLCDEPTGALDYMTGKTVLKLLSDINRDYNKTVIIITHNAAIAAMADKVIKVKSGKISDVIINSTKIPVEEIEW